MLEPAYNPALGTPAESTPKARGGSLDAATETGGKKSPGDGGLLCGAEMVSMVRSERELELAQHPEDCLTAAPSAAVSPHHRIRVLLADDHKILRDGLVSLLGCQPDIELVGEASDGQMALALARQTHPDVVVMDVTMPRLSGIEATRRLHTEMPQVRVIGLSMHEEEDMAQAMRAAGAVAYLTKGGPTEALVAAIYAAGSDQEVG